eukprot:SM000107S14095  [mRNA]  locus=s107:303140:307588:- [translate_table: standard]
MASHYRDLYKTKLCKLFQRSGICPRVSCNFAHGVEELRHAGSPPHGGGGRYSGPRGGEIWERLGPDRRGSSRERRSPRDYSRRRSPPGTGHALRNALRRSRSPAYRRGGGREDRGRRDRDADRGGDSEPRDGSGTPARSARSPSRNRRVRLPWDPNAGPADEQAQEGQKRPLDVGDEYAPTSNGAIGDGDDAAEPNQLGADAVALPAQKRQRLPELDEVGGEGERRAEALVDTKLGGDELPPLLEGGDAQRGAGPGQVEGENAYKEELEQDMHQQENQEPEDDRPRAPEPEHKNERERPFRRIDRDSWARDRQRENGRDRERERERDDRLALETQLRDLAEELSSLQSRRRNLEDDAERSASKLVDLKAQIAGLQEKLPAFESDRNRVLSQLKRLLRAFARVQNAQEELKRSQAKLRKVVGDAHPTSALAAKDQIHSSPANDEKDNEQVASRSQQIVNSEGQEGPENLGFQETADDLQKEKADGPDSGSEPMKEEVDFRNLRHSLAASDDVGQQCLPGRVELRFTSAARRGALGSRRAAPQSAGKGSDLDLNTAPPDEGLPEGGQSVEAMAQKGAALNTPHRLSQDVGRRVHGRADFQEDGNDFLELETGEGAGPQQVDGTFNDVDSFKHTEPQSWEAMLQAMFDSPTLTDKVGGQQGPGSQGFEKDQGLLGLGAQGNAQGVTGAAASSAHTGAGVHTSVTDYDPHTAHERLMEVEED